MWKLVSSSSLPNLNIYPFSFDLIVVLLQVKILIGYKKLNIATQEKINAQFDITKSETKVKINVL